MQYEKWDYFKVASTELAQALGVTRGTVWRWQTGLSKPTRRHQERVEQVLQELSPLVLPDIRKKDREPTLAENERSFKQTARLVADGWLPPEDTYKGVTSRTPFAEEDFRKTVQGIVSELEDNSQI